MNRALARAEVMRKGVPRTRGDEPAVSAAPVLRMLCSPHARG